jgi:hypothetical protein
VTLVSPVAAVAREYALECVELEFCELRLLGILRSSPPALCIRPLIYSRLSYVECRGSYAWPRNYADNTRRRIVGSPGAGSPERGYGCRRGSGTFPEQMLASHQLPCRNAPYPLAGPLAPLRFRKTILVGVRCSSTLSVLFQRFCQRRSLPISGSNQTPGPSGSSTPS